MFSSSSQSQSIQPLKSHVSPTDACSLDYLPTLGLFWGLQKHCLALLLLPNPRVTAVLPLASLFLCLSRSHKTYRHKQLRSSYLLFVTYLRMIVELACFLTAASGFKHNSNLWQCSSFKTPVQLETDEKQVWNSNHSIFIQRTGMLPSYGRA